MFGEVSILYDTGDTIFLVTVFTVDTLRFNPKSVSDVFLYNAFRFGSFGVHV